MQEMRNSIMYDYSEHKNQKKIEKLKMNQFGIKNLRIHAKKISTELNKMR